MNGLLYYPCSLLNKILQKWREINKQWEETRQEWVGKWFILFKTRWPKGWQWFEAKLLQKRLVNLPNLLSLSRIAAVWPIIKCLSLQNALGYLMASLLFIFIFLTDLLDGSVAKKGNCITIWGIGLDPIADRVLVLSLLIIQNYYRLLLWPELMWAVIGSEALFCLMRFTTFLLGTAPLTSNNIGKTKLFLQICVVILLLIKVPLTCQLWVNLILLASLALLSCNIVLEVKLIFKTVFSPKK